MSKNLSKREKVLVMILLVFALSYILGNYLLMPSFAAVQEAEFELENAKFSKIEADAYPGMIDNYKAANDELIGEIAKDGEVLIQKTDNMALDEIITNMVKSCGLVPVSLNVNPEEIIDATEIPPGSMTEWMLVATYVYRVDVKADGTMDMALKLLDAAGKITGLQVSRLDVSSSANTGNVAVSFDIYVKE